MTYISSLSLTSFRNYTATSIDGLDNGFVLLIGENGAGKTNCLEALSLLSPGRGLRNASVPDCQSQSNQTPWAISAALVDTDQDESRIGVGRNPQKMDKKIIRYNGDPVKSQNQLGEILRAVWLTPQMDGLFLSGASDRRRFFDRLVATFDAAHTGRMTRYEKAMRERLSLLRQAAEKKQAADPAWLSALETVMAETGMAIAAARIETLTILQHHIATDDAGIFPMATIRLNGDIEPLLGNKSALEIEDIFKQKLSQTRSSDGMMGRTRYGAHRMDMDVTHTQKSSPASQCSTGEQKGLLTTIILAHARMVNAKFGAPPLLLFDEITAHFDANKRDALYSILSDLGGQVWLTGQDINAFQSIEKKQAVTIENNQFQPL
jgi:DNA replication and repair protein RecF